MVLAISFTVRRAGSSMADSTAMIEITTSSSVSEKPACVEVAVLMI